MESIEYAIYIVFALMVGFLMLHAVIEVSLEEHGIKNDQGTYFVYDKEDFLNGIFPMWYECSMGEVNTTYLVHVKGKGNLTKKEIVDRLEKLNRLESLSKDKIFFDYMQLPALFPVYCNNLGMFIGRDRVYVIEYLEEDYLNCWINSMDFLECDAPQGKMGATKIVLRAYEQGRLVAERELAIAVTHTSIVTPSLTYISSAEPGSNFHGSNFVYAGREGEYIRRILLEFPPILAVDSSKLIGARLKFEPIDANGQTISVYQTTTPWLSAEVTWENPWVDVGGDVSNLIGTGVYDGISPVEIDVYDLVVSMISNPSKHAQLLIKADESIDRSIKLSAGSIVLIMHTLP